MIENEISRKAFILHWEAITIQLNHFDYYLIAINVVGFILFAINTWFYTHTEDEQIDKPLTIVSLLGGSLGIVLAILIIDRKAKKENMMSRVFVSCILVVQIVVFLALKMGLQEKLTFAFWEFFSKHKTLIIYLIVINTITLIAFGVDKISAIEGKSRIRIVTLLGLAFIGGSIGALLAMYAFNHKTNKDYFVVGVPLIIMMQVVVIFYLMNQKWDLMAILNYNS